MADYWVINVDESQQVRCDSFTLNELDAIAVKYGLASWAELAYSPLRSAGAAQALFDLACTKTGTARRELSAEEALDVFATVDDSGVAAEFQDGVPDPKPVANP